MARIKRLARLLQADISPEMSRGEILKACERKVIKMEEDFGIPKPTEFAGGSIASEECMLSAVDRCITYEQPMLQAGGANVTKDELEEFFRELWGWEYK